MALDSSSFCRVSKKLSPADSQPAHSAPYRVDLVPRKFEENKIGKLLWPEIIKLMRSQNKYMLLQLGSCRRKMIPYNFVDRELSAATNPDVYLISRREKCIDTIGEATVISSLDANRKY